MGLSAIYTIEAAVCFDWCPCMFCREWKKEAAQTGYFWQNAQQFLFFLFTCHPMLEMLLVYSLQQHQVFYKMHKRLHVSFGIHSFHQLVLDSTTRSHFVRVSAPTVFLQGRPFEKRISTRGQWVRSAVATMADVHKLNAQTIKMILKEICTCWRQFFP